MKKCVNCKIKFQPKYRKGINKVKYCLPCRPIVRKNLYVKYEKTRTEKRLKAKGYVVPENDTLLFYGYKEPLKKFKDGYGYYGVVSYNKERDKVQCHFCGRLFKNVGVHAALSHKLSKTEYKEKAGLEMQTALVGEGTRELLIRAHDEVPSFSQRGKTKKQIREHMIKMTNKAEKSGRTKWSLERRNKNGNCPEQLIDKIKKLAEKLGRRPRAKDYVQEYGSHQSIITVYGTWENALKIAGMKVYSEEKAEKLNPDFLLECMRQFYKMHHRTPRISDMRRGLLPYHQAYCKVFGTLNKARELAKIPVLIQISKYNWEEVLLGKK